MGRIATCKYCGSPQLEPVMLECIKGTEVGVYSFCSERCMNLFIGEFNYIICYNCFVWYHYTYMEHMLGGIYYCGKCYKKITGKERDEME